MLIIFCILQSLVAIVTGTAAVTAVVIIAIGVLFIIYRKYKRKVKGTADFAP